MALSTRGSRFVALAPAGLASLAARASGSAAATVLVSLTFAALFAVPRLALAARGEFVGCEIARFFTATRAAFWANRPISNLDIEIEFFVAIDIEIGVLAGRLNIRFVPLGGMSRALSTTTASTAATATTTATTAVALLAFFIAETALAGSRLLKGEIRAFRPIVIEHGATVFLSAGKLCGHVGACFTVFVADAQTEHIHVRLFLAEHLAQRLPAGFGGFVTFFMTRFFTALLFTARFFAARFFTARFFTARFFTARFFAACFFAARPIETAGRFFFAWRSGAACFLVTGKRRLRWFTSRGFGNRLFNRLRSGLGLRGRFQSQYTRDARPIAGRFRRGLGRFRLRGRLWFFRSQH
jgi:hypothetical protein